MCELENGIEVKTLLKRVNGFWRMTLEGPGWLLTDVASEMSANDGVFALGDKPLVLHGPTQLELVQIDKVSGRILPIVVDE